MPASRLTSDVTLDIRGFIKVTAAAWMEAELIKTNSYGVQILEAASPGVDFEDATTHEVGYSHPRARYGTAWYLENAHGKNVICDATKMDSHEAVRLWPGLLADLDGAYPRGGAIIDPAYGLIIGTSGFEEDEDILFSRTIRNRLVQLIDRQGDARLIDARKRGQREGDLGADRFTRSPS